MEGGKERLESLIVKNTESTSTANGGNMSPKSASGKSRTGALYLASIGNLRQPAIKRAGSEAIPDGMQTVATREAPPRDVTPNKRNNHVAQLERQLETELVHTCPEDAAIVPEPRHVKYATVMAKILRLKIRRIPTRDSGGYDGTTARMTREERTELAQARREVMLNLQGDYVVMNVGAEDDPVPYKRQGDPAVNTPRSIARRHGLRKKPLIQEITNEYWRFPELNPDASDEMSKESYLNLNRKLHLALIPETTDEEAVESAELDWARDTRMWGGRMTREAFASGMFELADIWTENINEEEYAAFLWLLLETITNTNVVPPSFKPDQEIECIVDEGLSEASMDEERERTSMTLDSDDIAAVLATNGVSEGKRSPWLKEKHFQRLRELRERLQALKELRMFSEGSNASGGGALEGENVDGNRGSGSGSGSELEIHDPWSRSPLAALDTSEHGRQDEGVSGDKVRTSDPTFVARERRQDECGGGMDSSYTDNNGLGGAALKESSPLERRNSLELDEGSTAVSDHWQDFNAADGQQCSNFQSRDYIKAPASTSVESRQSSIKVNEYRRGVDGAPSGQISKGSGGERTEFGGLVGQTGVRRDSNATYRTSDLFDEGRRRIPEGFVANEESARGAVETYDGVERSDQRMSEHRGSKSENIRVGDGDIPGRYGSPDFRRGRSVRRDWDGISRTTDEEWEQLIQEANEKKQWRAGALTETRAGSPGGKHPRGPLKASNGSDQSTEEEEEEKDEWNWDGKLAPTSPLEGNNAHEATSTPTGNKSVEPSPPPAQHVIRGFECLEGALMDYSWGSETVEDGHRRENSDFRDGVRSDSRITQASSPCQREDDERMSVGGLAGGMGEDKGKADENDITEDCWWWPEDVIVRLQGVLATHGMSLEDIFERDAEASAKPRNVVQSTKHQGLTQNIAPEVGSASVGPRPMGDDAVSTGETVLQSWPQKASSPSHAAGMPGWPTNDITSTNAENESPSLVSHVACVTEAHPSSPRQTLDGSPALANNDLYDKTATPVTTLHDAAGQMHPDPPSSSPDCRSFAEGQARQDTRQPPTRQDTRPQDDDAGLDPPLINSTARIEQQMNQSTIDHSPYPEGNRAPRASADPDAAVSTRAVDDGVMPGAAPHFKAGPNSTGRRYILYNDISIRIAESRRSMIGVDPGTDVSGTRNKPRGEASLIDRSHGIGDSCSVLGHDSKKETPRMLQRAGENVIIPDSGLGRTALERTGIMKRASDSTINTEEDTTTVYKSRPLRGYEATPKPYGSELSSSHDDSELVATPWQEAGGVITRAGITAVADVIANRIVEADGTLYAEAFHEVRQALSGVEEQVRGTTATSRLVAPPNVELAVPKDEDEALRVRTGRSPLRMSLGNIQQGAQKEHGELPRASVTGNDSRESPMVESGTPAAPAHHTRQGEDDDYLSPGSLSGGRLKQQANLAAATAAATTGGLSGDDKKPRKALSCDRVPAVCEDHVRTSRGDLPRDESAPPGHITYQSGEKWSREPACSSLVGKRTWSERALPSSYGRSRHSDTRTRGKRNTGDEVASNKLPRAGIAYPMDYDIHRVEAEYRHELTPRTRKDCFGSNRPGYRYNFPPPQGNAYHRRSPTRNDISGERRQEVDVSGGSPKIARGHGGGIPTRGGSADGVSSSRFGRERRKNLPSSWQHNGRRPDDVRVVSERTDKSQLKDGWRRPTTTASNASGVDESSPYYVERDQARPLVPNPELSPWRNPSPGKPAWHPILDYCETKQDEGGAGEIQERKCRSFLCCRGSGNRDSVSSDSSWDRSTRIQLCVGVTQPSEMKFEERLEVGELDGISADANTPATAFSRRVNSVGLLGRTPLNQVPFVPEGPSISLRVGPTNDPRSPSPTKALKYAGNPGITAVEGVSSGPGFNRPFLATSSSARPRSCGGTLVSSPPHLRTLLDPGGTTMSENVEYIVPLRWYSSATVEDGAMVRPVDRHQQRPSCYDTAETERPLPTAETARTMGREWIRPPSLVITPLVGDRAELDSSVQHISSPPLWSLSPITYPRPQSHAGSGCGCWTREFCLRHAQGRSRLAPATRTAGGRWGVKHGPLDTLFHGELLPPSLPSSPLRTEKGRWDKVLGPDADRKMLRL